MKEKRHLFRTARYKGWIVELEVWDPVKNEFLCSGLPMGVSLWVKEEELSEFVL